MIKNLNSALNRLATSTNSIYVLSYFQPSIIIHSAAERRPDAVEKQPEATRLINVESTRYICEAAGTFTTLITISDYRFKITI